MTKATVMKGINAQMNNRLDHNTLNSNVQIGDNNYEETKNTNIDDNEQTETTVINGGIHIHEGDFHLNPKQGQIGGSAEQQPKTKNYLSTDHAMNLLFGLIGLAIFAIGLGIAISCIKRKKQKRSRSIKQRILKHREMILMNQIQDLKRKLEQEPRLPPYNPQFMKNSRNDIAIPMNYSYCSQISDF